MSAFDTRTSIKEAVTFIKRPALVPNSIITNANYHIVQIEEGIIDIEYGIDDEEDLFLADVILFTMKILLAFRTIPQLFDKE